MRSANTVILFTKSPLICRVKTRMQPELNHRECLFLHKKLTENIISLCNTQADFRFVVYTTELSYHSFYRNQSINVKKQRGINLGVRMFNAIRQELKHSQRVILIGSDSLSLNRPYIRTALNMLKNSYDIVLGPADDGGYVLVGMSKAYQRIFLRIPWGTDQVMTQTLQSGRGYRIGRLKTVQDLDTHQDLIKLNEKTGLPSWARQLVK